MDVRMEQETVWLIQRQMANLFDTTPENVVIHLKNIFGDKELEEADEFRAVFTNHRKRFEEEHQFEIKVAQGNFS